jgi:hypothetical protein
MKTYTNVEKETLLNAIDHYIDAGEHARNILTDENKDRFIQELWKIRELRIKLILDIAPIKAGEAQDLFKRPCILCGTRDRGGSPEWGFVDGKKICDTCFEKYEPKLFTEIQKRNKEYWIKEYPENFNPDGTLKQGELVLGDDSLPF